MHPDGYFCTFFSAPFKSLFIAWRSVSASELCATAVRRKSHSLSLFSAKVVSEGSAVEILSCSNSSSAAESFSDFGLTVVFPSPLPDLKQKYEQGLGGRECWY